MTGTPRPLRVLAVDHTAALGGAEIALTRLAGRLRVDGVDVRVLLLGHGPLEARLRETGVPTIVHDLDPRIAETSREDAFRPGSFFAGLLRSARAVPALARRVRRLGADVIVANSLKSALLVAAVAPLVRRRWVWHLHDRIAADYLPQAAVLLLRGLAVVGPAMIVANSLAVRSTLPRCAGSKTRVAYPGVDVGSPPRRRASGVAPIIGMLGRISPTKGQREFIEAAAIVTRTRPGVRFRIVGAALFGEGDYAEALRREASSLGVDATVEFAGWSDAPSAELAGFDVFVHASPVPEPFGQVIVEAMLAGTPVIATRAGGVPEIVDPDETSDPAAPVALTEFGVLVPPGDAVALSQAIEACFAEPDRAAERAANAQLMARSRFDIAASAEVVRSAWRDSIRRPKGAFIRHNRWRHDGRSR